ncbi:DNA polymerase IV [Fulvivirga imtechensis AK7]|uniref:DNA polymerase IV n=1 Tax=Fulvivirga imtechensis AK7 TaxID=1237149 RepID=L8JYG7_9BACT|nr:DNA polymerase IV [Fulvivirga imtechensis AK7]
MDAFFASVEQRDHPELRGKPVAVGGSSERGVVAAASYEARKFGVRSAMPSSIAARKCPDLIFVRPRFDAYKAVSNQIRDIFFEYTDLVEPLSLDEAYLDVTHNKKNMPSATLIAREIKKRIKETTGLTASAGISINKFLAKTASDVNKPDGLFLIAPEDAEAYVERLAIEKFFGIGKVTAEKMFKMGIRNGQDLKRYAEADLVVRFGKAGRYYYRIARAIDDREVNPNRIRKSLGAENTFEKDLTELEEIRKELVDITKTLTMRMERSNTKGKTLTLKVKFHDFQQITRSKTITKWIENEKQITALYEELLTMFDTSTVKIRLLGLSLSNLNHEMEEPVSYQLTLDF